MISLRDYNREIESLVESNQIDEAISHCVAVLKSFPKSIDAYRNLGKALLESKRYPEAADVFSKVLAVFPDDFISHIGLSVIEEENRNLDAAIWHMEQAFELQPSNLALQEELRRLFGRRDGVPPTKIRLTRGALVKMYARGDLYQQAIAEIKSVLKDEPSRIDFKVLLAKMLQVSGSSAEAVEIASGIVSEYPYCYEANRILNELLPSNQQETGINIYRDRLIAVDPYYQFVDALTLDSTEVPSEKIMLEKQEFTPSFVQETGITDWSKQLGLNWQEKDVFSSTEPSSIMEQVDAFDEIAKEPEESSPVSPFIGDVTPDIDNELGEKTPNEPEPLPDWITKAGWTRPGDTSSSEEPVNEVQSEESNDSPAEPSSELPDWLKSFEPEGPGVEASEKPTTLSPSVLDILPEETTESSLSHEDFKDAITNWGELEPSAEEPEPGKVLSDVQSSDLLNELEDITNPSKENSDNNLPDWLRNFVNEEETTPSSEEDQSDWLPNLQDEEKEEIPEQGLERDGFTTGDDELFKNLDSILGEQEIEPLQPISSENLEEIFEEQEKKSTSPISPDNIKESTFPSPESPSEEIRQAGDLSPQPDGDHDESVSNIPSWVKNILSSSPASNEDSTSQIPDQATPSTSEPKTDEEYIEPLISDLPGSTEKHGVISEETNDDLISWLRDINPEDEELIKDQPALAESEIKDISDELSVEDQMLSRLTQEEQTGISTNEGEFEQLLPDESNAPEIEDRLSELLEQPLDETIAKKELEEESEFLDRILEHDEVQPEESAIIEKVLDSTKDIDQVPEEERLKTNVLGQLAGILETGEISTIADVLDNNMTANTPIDELIDMIQPYLQKYPDSYEIWQQLGDLYLKKADFDNALMAYNKAAQILQI